MREKKAVILGRHPLWLEALERLLVHDSIEQFEEGLSSRLRAIARASDRALKLIFDAAVVAALLCLLAPLIAVLAIAIKLDSPGPVFYRCRRVGFRGSEFAMLKFRKMRDGAGGLALTLEADERFTRFGRLLAKTKLDELPQLWNVLKGEMSLVGPRPEDPDFVALRPREYEEILTVKPGITGVCQLAFAKEGEILDEADRLKHYVERLLPQKARLDRLYAGRRTLAVDLRVLWWTAITVLLRRDIAVHRETLRMNVRRRPEVVAVVADAPSRGVAS